MSQSENEIKHKQKRKAVSVRDVKKSTIVFSHILQLINHSDPQQISSGMC
jgi:hypothetical protein